MSHRLITTLVSSRVVVSLFDQHSHYFKQLSQRPTRDRGALILEKLRSVAYDQQLSLTRESLRVFSQIEAFSFILDNATKLNFHSFKTAKVLFDSVINHQYQLRAQSGESLTAEELDNDANLRLLYWVGFQDTITTTGQLIKTLVRLHPQHRLQFVLDNLHKIKEFDAAMEIYDRLFVDNDDMGMVAPRSGLIENTGENRLAFAKAIRHTLTTPDACLTMSNLLNREHQLTFALWKLPYSPTPSLDKASRILNHLKLSAPELVDSSIVFHF